MCEAVQKDVKAKQRDGSSPLVGVTTAPKASFRELANAIWLECGYHQFSKRCVLSRKAHAHISAPQ